VTTSTITRVNRLDVSDAELAYLILQVDAAVYVARAAASGKLDSPNAQWHAKELTAATDRFVEVYGIDALRGLLDRMMRLARLRR
jgi:hypothetical protein